MARWMVSLGMFASRAARTAVRNRALCSASPPPFRAATVTSRMSLVKSTPLVAPIASFLRLIFVQRLWPDMKSSCSHQMLRPPASMRPSGPATSGWRAWRTADLSTRPRRNAVHFDARARRAPVAIAGKAGELDTGLARQHEGRRRGVGQPPPEQALGRGAQQERTRGKRVPGRIERSADGERPRTGSQRYGLDGARSENAPCRPVRSRQQEPGYIDRRPAGIPELDVFAIAARRWSGRRGHHFGDDYGGKGRERRDPLRLADRRMSFVVVEIEMHRVVGRGGKPGHPDRGSTGAGGGRSARIGRTERRAGTFGALTVAA